VNALPTVTNDEDNGPKTRFHDLGSEDGEMADVLALPESFDHQVMFNYGKGQWHVLNPKTGLWLPDKVADVQGRVDAMAVKWITASALGDKDDVKRVKVYRRLRETGRTESALKALSWRSDYKTDGSIFDRNPHLLGVQNGVIDLETMTLHRPDDFESPIREMYVSQAAAVAWPTGDMQAVLAAAKPFTDFLQDILSGDEDLTWYVLRLLGYVLIGTTQEEKFWLLVGGGNNGKGTLTKLLHWLLGDYATFLDQALYMRTRFGDVGADRARPELGNLWGKRFAVTSEPVKGQFNEQMLKAHTGRDPITFRRMRSDVLWTFNPTHKLFFTTQDAPSVEDVGPSMRRRARVIQFEQDYSANPDQHLQEKLEAIGQSILVLLAYQASEYLREGLPENSKVQAWSADYLSDNDPIRQFVADRCEVGKGLSAASAPVFVAYQEWCSENDREPGSQVAFGMAFVKRFKRDHTKTGAHYRGVRLLGALETGDGDQESDQE
jgi:putative DNA primase/helicase